MDRTSDFGSDSEGSNPSAVTKLLFKGLFFMLYPETATKVISRKDYKSGYSRFPQT